MFSVRKIDSFDSPELQPYRTMRRQLEHRQQGIFVAEGEKVVRRLLESKFKVVSVLLPQKWLHDLEPLLAARPEEIDVFVAEKQLLETLTGFSMYQGLLAVGKVPPPVRLDEILARSSRPLMVAPTCHGVSKLIFSLCYEFPSRPGSGGYLFSPSFSAQRPTHLPFFGPEASLIFPLL